MTRISVKVIPNASKNQLLISLDAVGIPTFTFRTTAPPAEGKANKALIEALARHFEVPKSQVNIVLGTTTRKKVVEVMR